MSTTHGTLVILGASGFLGRHVTQEALKTGWKVKALARSEDSARSVSDLGATTFLGDADRPNQWIREVEGAHAIIDLVQPRFPPRIGLKLVQAVSVRRQSFARGLVSALGSLKGDRVPLLISVSGIDDLAPDKDGYLSAHSPLRAQAYGFNRIGIPVRRVIEQSKVKAAFACLGTVYGPGKGFASAIFPQIAKGKWRNFGNRMAVIHVEDAARGLIHVAESVSRPVAGNSFVLTDDCPVEMQAFFGFSASCMGVPAPGRIPMWLASLFAGRTLVESILCDVPIHSSIPSFRDFQLRYPTYREGIPATLAQLGYVRAT